jgi:hypothetical protein
MSISLGNYVTSTKHLFVYHHYSTMIPFDRSAYLRLLLAVDLFVVVELVQLLNYVDYSYIYLFQITSSARIQVIYIPIL